MSMSGTVASAPLMSKRQVVNASPKTSECTKSAPLGVGAKIVSVQVMSKGVLNGVIVPPGAAWAVKLTTGAAASAAGVAWVAWAGADGLATSSAVATPKAA